MEAHITRARTQRFLRMFSRVVIIVGLVLIAGLSIAHFAWKYSGSGKFELEKDQDGVQVYSKKIPGETLKTFKVVARLNTTMNRIVADMSDTSVEHCKMREPSCAVSKTIDDWRMTPDGWHNLTYYRLNMPYPFYPRDLVIKQLIYQDPKTKAVTVEVKAAPGVVPDEDCCVRVDHANNYWIWTPLKNGETELVIISDIDGRFPYFIQNQKVEYLWQLGVDAPKYTNQEQYANQKFDFIQEPNIDKWGIAVSTYD